MLLAGWLAPLIANVFFVFLGGDHRCTISIGVSGVIPSFPQGLKNLINSADCAIYQAKQAGYNCIVGEESNKDERTL